MRGHLCTAGRENGVCTVEELEDAAANHEYDYAFLADLPYGQKNRLEGYLFPDTYEFYVGDDPVNVLDKFLRRFDSKVTEEMYDAVDALNANLAEKMAANGFYRQRDRGRETRHARRHHRRLAH